MRIRAHIQDISHYDRDIFLSICKQLQLGWIVLGSFMFYV